MTALTTKEAPADGQSTPSLRSDPARTDGEKHGEDHNGGLDTEAKYPSTFGLALIAAGLCLSVFLVALVGSSPLFSN